MVSVIIVNYNAGEDLRVALEALRSSQGCEVIVVDNASTDDASSSARVENPWVRWIQLEHNVGFGAANNIGAKAASGDVFLLLNPDASICGADLEQVSALCLEDERVGALGFRQVDRDGHWQLSMGPTPTVGAEILRKVLQGRLDAGAHGLGALIDRALPRRKPVAWVAGSALAVKRSSYERVDGFDERFFLYFEDIDFCLRVGRLVGPVVYEPRLSVTHVRGVSARSTPREAREHYRRSQELFWSIYGQGRLGARFMRRYARYRLDNEP